VLHIAEHCQQEQARKRGAGELSRDVADDAQPGKVAAHRECKRDHRVQVGA